MEKSVRIIKLDEDNVIIKRYKIRSTGKLGATLETSLPKEAFEREARRIGLTFEEALEKLVAVWRFNDFRGLLLSFELPKEEAKRKGA